jgi:hypothetical protein
MRWIEWSVWRDRPTSAMPNLLTKSARWTALIASVGLAGVVVWSRFCAPREPFCQGRSLTEWLGDLVEPDGPLDRKKRSEARKIILAMDTNAVPGLLALMSRRDSAARKWAHAMLSKQSVFRFRLLRAEGARELAFLGFEVLGPRAEPAIPVLERLAMEPDLLAAPTRALVCIGRPASLALGRTLTSNNPTVRQQTAMAIYYGRRYYANAWSRPERTQLPDDLQASLRQLTTNTNAWELAEAAGFLLSPPEPRGKKAPDESHAPGS